MKQIIFFLITFTGIAAFAQDADSSFISSLVAWVTNLWSDAPTLGKVTSGIVLLISTMKVSFLKPLWDKLKEKQEWLAPVLGLVGAIATLFINGEFSFELLLTGLAGGALAPYVHDLLDYLKAIPGLGKVWLTVIEIFKKVLFAPKETPTTF